MSRVIKIVSFIGLTIAMFMGTLDSTIVNIALPKIMAHFNTSITNVSWVSTIYTLSLAVFMITGSKIADRYGRKKIMLFGLALFGGFSAACMLSNSLLELIIFRFFQGIGGAIITPIVLPMGIEIFGKKNTSRLASVVGAVTALAAAGGPPIGGIILEYASWREVFGINVPLTIVSFIIISIWINESYDETLDGKIDILGTILLTIGLSGITFGMLEGRQYGWNSSLILSCIIGGILALVIFVAVERKIKNPLLELDLFREKTLTASSLVYFITGFALICPMLIFNYFLQDVLNYSALTSALIIMPISLTIMVSMPLGTKLFEKIGAIPVTLSGLIIMASSLYLLSFINVNTPKEIMVIFVIINGIGFGFSCVSLVASVKHLPQNKNGIGSGIVNAARQIGTCLGVALLVTVLDGNVTSAKNTIRQNSIRIIENEPLSTGVKTTAHVELNKLFSTNDSSTISTKNKQKHLRRELAHAAKATKNLPTPKHNSGYGKIYHAELKISQATTMAAKKAAAVTDELNLISKKNTLLAPLVSNSLKINKGTEEISQSQQKVLTVIKLLAQKEALTKALTRIKNEKNQHISSAFSHTYILGSLIVLLLSPVALWTDRKNKE
ncbi:MFS transporter [Liquorilactobacillus mali]|uniref:Permease of the major facilitator superfamily-like protein n=1 Tax=Liquorilactobacillus mali TaxID=1618 RepID=A0A0R2FTB5_9LACO|nr:MFS transporter [Liquorilactobacillus mali]KRN28029.1 permease of the major facilitator superfamily-like protein [Liquorilactobacillus mali]